MAYIGKSPSVGVRDRYYYTATGSEISLSGPDDFGRTLVFTDGKYVDVTLNGITLVAGVDYNTNTTNTISGLDPLTVADIVEVVVYDVFAIADTVSAARGGTFEGPVTFNGDTIGINLSLDSLNDVNLGTPLNGQVLTYKDSSGQFELDSAASAMAQLSDVNLTGLQDGHTIVYNSSSGEFLADSIAGTNILSGTVGYSQVSFVDSDAGAMTIPSGTTAQRPASPSAGMIRYNTDTNFAEVYDGTGWIPTGNMSTAYDIQYLVVAGGGGGGSDRAGGGGAGGYIAGSTALAQGSGNTYSIIVGAGGAGGPSDETPGSNGANSSAFGDTSIGGGGGGAYNSSRQTGADGGSGGGGMGSDESSANGGSGTSGQGNAGGNGAHNIGGQGSSGGGGGAGAAGGNAVSNGNAGDGGAGLQWLDGNYYAGGGGGGKDTRSGSGNAGDGGIGGGGQGGEDGPISDGQLPVAGAANTGGGGGGSGVDPNSSSFYGKAGGSGIVIIRYTGVQRGTGGTVTSSGGYTYHTFTSSGTYTA